MKAKIIFLAGIVSSFFIQHSALAQGALTPPGGPGPVMRSLDQIYARLDARIPITNSSTPVTISTPGSYYLTTNLTVSNGNPITIATNNVTLDLNGCTVTSTGSGLIFGVFINAGLKDLAICNGFLRGGYTNNGSGTFGGSGLYSGIQYFAVAPLNVRVSHVTVSGCGNMGIYLGASNTTLVEFCAVRTIGGDGILASTIQSSSAADCAGNAIHGDQVSDCRGEAVTSGNGIYANVANNCYGSSVSGDGLFTFTAQNCNGVSSSGYGINSVNASNCGGSSNTGNGLSASTAVNCNGHSSGSGFGVSGTTMLNCAGDSVSGPGITGFLANGCHGISNSGTAIVVSHNINSF